MSNKIDRYQGYITHGGSVVINDHQDNRQIIECKIAPTKEIAKKLLKACLAILNDEYEENNTTNKLQEICTKYHIPFNDLPEILEEYIATDNEEYLEKIRSNTKLKHY